MKLTKIGALVASSAAALALVVIAPAPAGAVTVTGGHLDLEGEIVCDVSGFAVDEVELVVHEDPSTHHVPSSLTISLPNTTSASARDASVLGVAQGSSIGRIVQGGAALAVGFALEYDAATCDPSYTPGLGFQLTSATAPGTAAAYQTSGPGNPIAKTVGNTVTTGLNGSNLTAANDHIDYRWGFTAEGTYALTFTATAGGVSASAPLQFTVT